MFLKHGPLSPVQRFLERLSAFCYLFIFIIADFRVVAALKRMRVVKGWHVRSCSEKLSKEKRKGYV